MVKTRRLTLLPSLLQILVTPAEKSTASPTVPQDRRLTQVVHSPASQVNVKFQLMQEYLLICEQIDLSIGWTHLLHAAKRRTAMDTS